MRFSRLLQTVCVRWCEMGARWAHNFDENPQAFRIILPLRVHALITQFSISDVKFNVQSGGAFDENPHVILRNLDQHGNVHLPSGEVRNLYHVGRTKREKCTPPLAKRVYRNAAVMHANRRLHHFLL